MTKLGLCIPLLGLLVVTFGCGDSEPQASSKHGKPSGVGGTAGTAGTAGSAAKPSMANPCGAVDTTLADKNAAELFAYPTVPTFDLALPADDWASLQINAREEQYVEAQACFDGKAVGRVGLRFKGSYGSLFNCFDSAGVNTCRKLGMKIKFDKFDADQRFYGLKRLNFHGYHWDNSYIKERIAYDLYAAMDVIAPRASWAKLRVNGETQGLFGMVEEIDGRFTSDRWQDNGDANLYKEVWPGKASDDKILTQLQTNQDLAVIDGFKAFSAAMKGATEGQYRDTLAKFSDLEYWARYMAVDDAIANYDGITTYYTSGAADLAGNHNFFIYEDVPQHFTIIPWDLEATLSTASGFGNVPIWQTTPVDCSLTYRAWADSTLRVIAPGCDPVFKAVAADLASYHAQARRLLDGPFAEATMLAKIDALASFIRTEATADPHGPSAEEFEQAVGFLRQDIPRLRNRLEFIQTGKPALPVEVTVGQTMGFEATDDYGLTIGTMMMCNTNSTVAVNLDTTTPINGNQTLRIVFNYGNEATPYQQWSFFRIPLANGTTDLSTLTGIRVKARSNQVRVVRFDLISPKDSGAMQGIHFGWDLTLTTQSQPFEVRFANAAIPNWAKDPGDKLAEILKAVGGISYQPMCVGTGATGQLPDGVRDNGWVEIDDIEFF